MSPRIRLPHRYRTLVLWLAGALLCLASYGVLWLVAQIEARMVREENTISVPADRRGPALEQALRSMADSWREENRNR